MINDKIQQKDVCLVQMPYAYLHYPSLGLGLLDSYISALPYSVEVIYGNLIFAMQLGLNHYQKIINARYEFLMGDWTFAPLLFPDKKYDPDDFFTLIPKITEEGREALLAARREAPVFIEATAQQILDKKPRVVGCGSTFQQNCASLALLKALKARDPNLKTLMGGSNCEGEMGQALLQHFPYVDYVFSGEADTAISPMINQLMEHGKIITKISGVLSRDPAISTQQGAQAKVPRVVIQDMRQVGKPNYDSYFSTLDTLGLRKHMTVGLLVETSRGCWWGAKKHCTFCGLNGMGMSYRAKAPACVLEEWDKLSEAYSVNNIQAVDNILSHEYMDTFLPLLEERGRPYQICYETKANLKRDQVEKLYRAGVRWINPGIESLNDAFLKDIDKGINAIQNVATLKWCREFGIYVIWNFMHGIPKEKAEWYQEMAHWLPLISHFFPPTSSPSLRYHRYSPYFYRPKEFALSLVPAKVYHTIYPFDEKDLAALAYHFEDKQAKVPHVELTAARKAALTKVRHWRKHWKQEYPPLLYMVDKGATICLWDTRPVATQFSHTLEGLAAQVYRMCHMPLLFNQLMRKLNQHIAPISEDAVHQTLNKLQETKLLLHLSNRFLALAVEGEMPRPLGHSAFAGDGDVGMLQSVLA